MAIQEGQIYEGGVSITGDNGAHHKWIVVSPFGKTHIHSIDNPLETHCWPASVVEAGLHKGLLKLVGHNPDHPSVRLQRAKEALHIHDPHLGLNDTSVNQLLDLLQTAVDGNMDTAPYLAGEILAFLDRSVFNANDRTEIKLLVEEQMDKWQQRQ